MGILNGPELILIAVVLIMVGGIAIAWIMAKKQTTPTGARIEPAALRDEVVDHLKGIATSFGNEIARLLQAQVARLEKVIDDRLNRPQSAPTSSPATAVPAPAPSAPAVAETAMPAQEKAAVAAPPATVAVPSSVLDDPAVAEAVRAAVAKAIAERIVITLKG